MTHMIVLFALLTSSAFAGALERVPECEDLNWSAQVIAANPDISRTCLGVYMRNNKFFAKSQIEIVRVSGNSLTFRPLRRDGSLGKPRRVTVPMTWRAQIDGVSYRAADLFAGQRLNVYIPEDRFALTIHGGSVGDGEEGQGELLNIEEAEVGKPAK